MLGAEGTVESRKALGVYSQEGLKTVVKWNEHTNQCQFIQGHEKKGQRPLAHSVGGPRCLWWEEKGESQKVSPRG